MWELFGMASRRSMLCLYAATVGALAGGVLSGCSSSKTSGSPSSPSVSQPSASPAGSATSVPTPNLNAHLLQLSDLPAGWSVDNTSDSNSSEPSCFKNATTFKSEEMAKAEAKFQNGSNGVPLLEDEVVFMPGKAQPALSRFRQLMAGCGQVSFSSDGHTFTGTIGQMSFPSFGVETQAYQMNLSTKASGLTITAGFDFVVARFADDEVLVFAYGDVGTPDISQVQAYAEKAASKVAAA